MKTILSVLIIACLLGTNHSLNAQNTAIGRFMRTSPQNAEPLIKAYFDPLFKAVAPALNEGWYNTADAHRFGEFDIKIVGSVSFVPSEQQFFDASTLGLSELEVTEGTRTATFFGPSGSDAWQEVIYRPSERDITLDESQSFALADGSDLSITPNASFQVNVGLPFSTELMLRFVPNIDADDLNFNSWGIGIKHEITESVPRINLLPFDISLGFAYSRLNSKLDLLLLPEINQRTGLPYPQADASNTASYDNQEASFQTDALNFSLIVSKTIKVLALYGGIRYDQATTNLKFVGDYPVTNADFLVENFRDPIDLSQTFNQVGLNLGAELRLGIFTLGVAGSVSEYSSASLTLGFGRYGLSY